jgi:ribosomal-protein-alanine N-acetyltransferase
VNIKIRSMQTSDLEKLSLILETDFDNFWNFNILKQELENPNSEYFVALQDDEIVGFAGIWYAVDDIHITNIVTKKAYRNSRNWNKIIRTLNLYSK